MLIHEATVTKLPRGSVIQLQSEFKAHLLNLEHNTALPKVSLRPPRSAVAGNAARERLKSIDVDDGIASPLSDTNDYMTGEVNPQQRQYGGIECLKMAQANKKDPLTHKPSLYWW